MPDQSIESKVQEWRAQIQSLSEAIWEGHAKEQAIKDWLSGFTGEVCDEGLEKVYALYLLQHFIYFGKNEINALLYALFRDHILYPQVQRCLDENVTSDDDAIRDAIVSSIFRTKIVPVGEVSESGSRLSYSLRQMADLTGDSIQSMSSVLLAVEQKMPINRVILIDDFLGTGDQLCETHAHHVQVLRSNNVTVEYVALVALYAGIQDVTQKGIFDQVNAVITMDDSYSFNSDKCIFLEALAQHPPLNASECLKVIRHYGQKILPGLCMGHGDCGVMVGFEHNTQDNSLPIFWVKSKNPRWNPIFARQNKIYQFKA